MIDDRVPHHDRGSGDPRMAKLLGELADPVAGGADHPIAVDQRGALRDLLERGIEVARATERFDLWFDRRRYPSPSCSSVARRTSSTSGPLRRTQPQARRIFDIEALAFRRYVRDPEKAQRVRQLELKDQREPTPCSVSRSTRRRSPGADDRRMHPLDLRRPAGSTAELRRA